MSRIAQLIRFICFCMVAAPVFAFAPAATPRDTATVSGLHYDPISGDYYAVHMIVPSEADATAGKIDFDSFAIFEFSKAQERLGTTVSLIENYNEAQYRTNFYNADFQIIIDDIPLVVDPQSAPPPVTSANARQPIIHSSPNINPELPINHHAGGSNTERKLNSPWVRAVLYDDMNHKTVGGIIIIKKSAYVAINDLYAMAHDNWSAIGSEPTDTMATLSADSPLVARISNEYQAARAKDSTADAATTINSFAAQGTQALTIARLASISSNADLSYTAHQCFEESRPFYFQLYDELFGEMLQPSATNKPNALYNLLPAETMFKLIASPFRDGANCFIHKPYSIPRTQ